MILLLFSDQPFYLKGLKMHFTHNSYTPSLPDEMGQDNRYKHNPQVLLLLTLIREDQNEIPL
jgi:hypothetical protein